MTPQQPLAKRIEQALRTAAFDCDGTCGMSERECDTQHPIQVAALHHGETASVYGDIDALAAVAAAAVQPELDQLRAELAGAQARTAAVLALPVATPEKLKRMDPADYQQARARNDVLAHVQRLLIAAAPEA